tara:strand:- start:965 stop:1588 length:624 start_codon:yes stop_codon:yes gene_type:complete
MTQLNPEALEAHNPFQGPIPGQSLTNSPDSQQPWEQPPEVTGIKDGRELMFLEIIKEENLEAIVTLMNDGMSIAQITEMLLFIGYSKGKFNADLMMLLAEPTMYMLLSIAEVVGIEPKINRDDLIDVNEEELDEEETADLASLTTKLEQKIRNPKSLEDLQEKLEKTAIPRDIQERVEQIDFESIKESLLARSPKQEQVNDSLLQRK